MYDIEKVFGIICLMNDNNES